MFRCSWILLLAACAGDPGPAADSYDWQNVKLSADERKQDPRAAAEALIEQREKPGNLDRAIALLSYHLARHPDAAEFQLLLAEAHSRSAEMHPLDKPENRPLHAHHRSEGLEHARRAVALAPASGPAHYWLAALLLHAADAEQSLGRAKEALKELAEAEKLDPRVDQGGPARMQGKVLSEMPPLVGGSLSKGVQAYQRSLAIAPNCITTHLWLGQSYADAKKYDLARKELEWVKAATPRPGHEKEDGADREKAEELFRKIATK